MPRHTLPQLPLRRSVLACALMLSSLPAAHAQDAPAADTAAIDQVTVVGSRARNRTVFDSAVPIELNAPLMPLALVVAK